MLHLALGIPRFGGHHHSHDGHRYEKDYYGAGHLPSAQQRDNREGEFIPVHVSREHSSYYRRLEKDVRENKEPTVSRSIWD
jgi:hypothetical protein